MTTVAGIEIPSSSPTFLAGIAFHVFVGLCAVIAGIVAMLSKKAPGRHPTFGTMYYWSLSAVALSATALAVVRWADDYHLFVLGLLAFTAATLGRIARRQRWDHWAWFHVVGMGLSYILLLTALYVDNGKSLPIWRDLPSITYWLLPSLVGIPLIVLRWHPVVRRRPWPER
jgi:uncharacterized membrane protein